MSPTRRHTIRDVPNSCRASIVTHEFKYTGADGIVREFLIYDFRPVGNLLGSDASGEVSYVDGEYSATPDDVTRGHVTAIADMAAIRRLTIIMGGLVIMELDLSMLSWKRFNEMLRPRFTELLKLHRLQLARYDQGASPPEETKQLIATPIIQKYLG